MRARTFNTWMSRLGHFVAAASCLAIAATQAFAQGTSGPTVSDSKVGYIDSAIPGNQLFLRYDSAFNNRRATRGEFFYAQTQPKGPGLPFPETSVDYQELAIYGEYAFSSCFSAFCEIPTRYLNPEINDNSAGLSDVNAGCKWAFWQTDDIVASFQLRGYFPTGDAGRGLGTRHVSLEPALLCYARLTDRFVFEGELRDWIAVGGTDFAGNALRYGAGLHYDLVRNSHTTLSPVVEFVGWTFLSGKTAMVEAPGQVMIADAAGDSILNIKLGVRTSFNRCGDVYIGYGRPLTGERWYDNTFRIEWRLTY